MPFTKWVHVKVQGWKGLATVPVTERLTVAEFKALLGLGPYSQVTVPATFLPLAGETVLYNIVNQFDTVRVERR